ncbi:hypothetical protein HHUSO_G21519 [Huso huso]|uniref:Uncharacterized protein n=1 Tax=Huso huso TaxID=61971 RepID=A0ABR0YZC9_HUSHU
MRSSRIPGLLRRVLKGSDRKSRHQEVGEWSLEECRHSIMELAKEMNRVLKNSAIPTPVSSEDTCSLEECRCFIMKWAGDLDKLVQTPKQSQSAGQVEQRKGAELRNKEDLPGPEGEELSEGAGHNQGEELNQEEEQRLKDGHDIIMGWARELKTVPENSVSAGEAVEQGLAELVKEWKHGKLRNILPIMEFIMWALIKEEADKGIGTRMWFSRMLKSLNIGEYGKPATCKTSSLTVQTQDCLDDRTQNHHIPVYWERHGRVPLTLQRDLIAGSVCWAGRASPRGDATGRCRWGRI